ncbi:zinc finger BED domain-containing protein RICESLEEPER 3-like [Folsomia candida]|nr:zinc finger BED domain-containing protein RICESLEEPER 3-like [Folsomia candida]
MSPEKVPTQECSTSLVAQLYKKRKLDERSEFDRYMALPVIAHENNGVPCNRLEWWKANESQFPGLAKMSRDYLATPATSAPSERAFSSAKLLIGNRYKLSSGTISECMCLKSWAKSKILD